MKANHNWQRRRLGPLLGNYAISFRIYSDILEVSPFCALYILNMLLSCGTDRRQIILYRSETTHMRNHGISLHRVIIYSRSNVDNYWSLQPQVEHIALPVKIIPAIVRRHFCSILPEGRSSLINKRVSDRPSAEEVNWNVRETSKTKPRGADPWGRSSINQHTNISWIKGLLWLIECKWQDFPPEWRSFSFVNLINTHIRSHDFSCWNFNRSEAARWSRSIPAIYAEFSVPWKRVYWALLRVRDDRVSFLGYGNNVGATGKKKEREREAEAWRWSKY